MLPVVRAGCDLGLFNHIGDSAQPLSSAQLANKCGTSPLLLGRLLRYMASLDVVRETAPDAYSATTTTTRALATRDWQSAVFHKVVHSFDVISPCVAALPDFLKEHGCRDSQDPADCAFNRGHKTDQRCFSWFPSRPELFGHFNRFMRVQRDGMPTWLDVYPYLEAARAAQGPEQVLFVDVGGGIGHQSVALRRALPADVAGRIIVQDLPALAEQAALRREDGVEHLVHDFFSAQPVRGARMYYMRNIMHDWRDEDAVAILQRVREAMGRESVLLIDDMVLPNSGTHWHAAQLDIVMMVALAARERTRKEWEELIPRAGLRMKQIYRYTEALGDSIIECVRDEGELVEKEEEEEGM
ncbi:hypothetical protein LLEC1_05338 [Akanthomyces lecanii]|uniref:Uncharacterized protein n=1 Tax=Cordyceps confragosa TaxID=2714763 RepID=A0A179I6K5_CORDF|nr:hypothetical protein LLEC1_05338 [Akanthomyces lecanii]